MGFQMYINAIKENNNKKYSKQCLSCINKLKMQQFNGHVFFYFYNFVEFIHQK